MSQLKHQACVRQKQRVVVPTGDPNYMVSFYLTDGLKLFNFGEKLQILI